MAPIIDLRRTYIQRGNTVDADLQKYADEINADTETGEIVERDPLEVLGQNAATAIYSAIQNATNQSARSAQQQNFQMGPSNLGHCRQYAKLMTEQTPFSDETDKTAAFIGTVLGRAIEEQMAVDHPNWVYQADLVFTIEHPNPVNPPKVSIPAHPDILVPASEATEEFPQAVWDLKSKDKLAVIRKQGQSTQQLYQLTGYAKAGIDAGLLDPTQPILLVDVFYDRSGEDHYAYPIAHWYDPDVLTDIDMWVDDVKYAVINKEDAERDRPREFCQRWCEYFTTCRTSDTDVEGLLTDDEILAAVAVYREGGDLKSRGEKMQKAAKPSLRGVIGSTGTHLIREVQVQGGRVEYDSPAYTKMSIVNVPQPKASKK